MDDLPDAIRTAVRDSLTTGRLDPALCNLVHALARTRIGVAQVAEDVAQTVLLGLVRGLAAGRIRSGVDGYHYVGSGILRVWRNHCRQRRVEYRYLRCAAITMLGELQVVDLGVARGQLVASFDRVCHRRIHY